MIDDSPERNNPLKSVLVLGGAHIDRNGTMEAPYIKGSSIPGTMSEDIGGGAFNIASNLARLNIPVIFSSPRADESLTFKIRSKLQNLPNIVDFPIQIEGNSPSYTALKDENGELIAALADMQLYDNLGVENFLTEELQDKIKQTEVLVTDANFPSEVITAIGHLIAENCKWYAVATSPAKVKKLLPSLTRLNLLSMNINEAMELTTSTNNSISEIMDGLQDLGLKTGIITDGPKGLHYFSDNNIAIKAPPFPSNNVLDVTGAGDATLAGYIASTLRGKYSEEALRVGLAAAKITIETNGACSEQLSMKSIEAVMAAQ